ncbi:MAG: hypothetical protein BMS9Abin05_2611 [Rhodothermia bacterium]|nr:MAG: hypothetical protein BMS9Abin05_2611 [Rhodothermia bacterium]
MKNSDRPSNSKRRFFIFLSAALGAGALGGVAGSLFWASNSTRFLMYIKGKQTAALGRLARNVLPLQGHKLEVSFGDSIRRLVEAGAISPRKFKLVYAKRGGLPAWVEELFTQSSSEPITMSFQTAPYLLNLMWPLGMATKTQFNDKSKLNGPKVGRFASTAGWILGEALRGGGYFNKVSSIDLTTEQEAAVLEAAENSYRPCCNNSTFFQDCNHGSALLGLYELAASQGANTDELYAIGRSANSFWYPSEYIEMAYFFRKLKGKSWNQVAAKTILEKKYSSIGGWQRNVHLPMVEAGLLPRSQLGGASNCGV